MMKTILLVMEVTIFLISNNIEQTFSINYGLNYFPEKNYKGVRYEEGNYESLVVTIGKGKGSNFWCVLFPPLCNLEVDNTEDVTYKFKVKEIIDSFLNKI